MKWLLHPIWSCTIACVMAPALAPADQPNSHDRLLVSVIEQKCTTCHSGEDAESGIDLDQFNLDRLDREKESSLELVQRVSDVIENEEMPPEDEPGIAPENRSLIVYELKGWLRQTIEETAAYPHTPIRRVNRFQYNNAVVDLFDLQCVVFTLPERMMREHRGYFKPATQKMAEVVHVGSRPLGKSQMIEPRLAGVAAFPQDLRAEHGFDNQADHLSMSPLLMESFLKLGQSITESPDFTKKRVGIWDQFFASPIDSSDQMAAIRVRLDGILRKAFRRDPDPALVDRYEAYAQTQLQRGVSFEQTMKSIAAAVIASPRFLYLYDTESRSESRQVSNRATVDERIDGYELASRLSFFLWGSLPDDTLLSLASDGSLSEPEILAGQVDRMLKDRKLKRFCDSFASQWLQLERIISSVPDRSTFPEFYYSKYRNSMHMMLEPLLIFETVLIENQPITQLIDSDFTYRSGQLQQAYRDLALPVDIKLKRGGVTALQFHRIPVTDRRSGGVITNAAVMTMTSGPDRTQPITRGAWIASVIFNDPPEPPPADVPPLGEKPSKGEEHLTLRERLALHRERSDCRGCHKQIDPLGFALENYDAIGTWRDEYPNGRQVDVAGNLLRNDAFDSVVEFKDVMLAYKQRFARALAGHLLSFALAREIAPADQVALDQIVEKTAADDYRFKTLIREVVLSKPFQRKSSSQPNDRLANKPIQPASERP